MSTIVNERYSIMSKVARTSAPSNASLQIVPDALAFHVDAQGNPTPSVINLTAVQQNMAGTIVWSAAGGTVKNITQTAGANVSKATIAYADVLAAGVTITCQVIIAGQTFTTSLYIGKYSDGASVKGDPGKAGDSYGAGYLFQWAPSQPATPTGVGTFGWQQNNLTSYSKENTDGWHAAPPANPNTPGWMLWIASKGVTAAAGTVSSLIDFTVGVGIIAYGANGTNGAPGIKSTTARAYAWSIGLAPSLVGSSTWTWAANSYNNVPTNWSATKTAAPSKGYTLYEADFPLLETAGAATSAIDWTKASIVATGYLGTDGSGTTGQQGASTVIAYTLADTNTLAGTPPYIATAIGAVPPTGTWGETRAWTSQPSVPSAGQAVFMSVGISDPSTGKVTWNLPYLSNLRVGSLSAISANLGNITAGSLNINNRFIVDANGNLQFKDANGNTVLDINGPAIVGGTSAGLVASRALNGDSAYNAVNNASTGLSSRMSLGARNVLGGQGGIVAGSLTYDNNGNRTGGYGVAWNQSGIVAYNLSGVPTFVVDASSGGVTARALTILGPGDQVILTTDRSLAQQAYSNPNLCPTPIGMLMYGGATGNRNGDVRFGDGQYVAMPPTGDGSYCGAQSGPLRIPAGSSYTVSFDVYSNSNTGRVLNVDVAGTGVDSNGITIVPTTTMKRYSFTEVMPANGTNGDAQLRMFTVAPGGDYFIISSIKVELGNTVTPWCDSIITPANSSTFIQSAAIQSAMVADLRTANYAEDGSGNPTSGAKLASTGTALKVANNSLQVGNQIFTDYWFRLVQAIDGSYAAGRVIWRGNNDITTRGGAPNIACLTMTPMSSQVLNSNFQQVTYGFLLSPSNYNAYTDNLDAMAQLHAQFFVPGSASPFTEVYTACPSRTYDGAAGQVRGTVFHGWRFAGGGQTPGVGAQYESNGVFTGNLRVRIGNSYGWSATQDFGAASSVGTPLNPTTIGSGGSTGGGSGGGSGGGGGQCPAPWVKVQLISGKEVAAGDLHDGAVLAAVNDSTLNPVVKGGIVRDIAIAWAPRFRVKLTDGEATEWSENHRFYVFNKGWTEVQKLLPEDHIVGQKECIVESVLYAGKGQVVGFRVEGAGTYFAGGMLSHNIKMLP